MTEQHTDAPPHHHHHAARADPTPATPEETERHWEQHYGAREQVWSGNPNPVFARIVEPITAGRALDLGCGEGADAVWLARHGWAVTAVDVSATALERARALAAHADVEVHFERHDLTQTFPAGPFDLISAQFLQSPLEFPRHRVLHTAANALAPGGLLLVVDHGSLPPWSAHKHEGVYLPSPREVFDGIGLDPERWHAESMDTPVREVTGPDGEKSDLVDNVLAVRRTAL